MERTDTETLLAPGTWPEANSFGCRTSTTRRASISSALTIVVVVTSPPPARQASMPISPARCS
ncbi:MAG: hypothetical protein M3Q48_10530 [Actinomycetota bacterium]|nr:hypothetical protein [Actinomycetota bacterium]